MSGPDDRRSRSPVIEQIIARRSYRGSFDGRPVAREDLDLIASCGLAAPSSKNAQPWRLHVVTDRQILEEIADVVRASPSAPGYVPRFRGDRGDRWVSTVIESADILEAAPAAIFIENLGHFGGGRHTGAHLTADEFDDWIVGYGFEMIGLGAAIENMWLAAESLGLAAAFLGDVGVEEDFIRRHLSLSGDLIGVHVFGHPADHRGQGPVPLDPAPRLVWHDASDATDRPDTHTRP